jgi:hypothetical protein
MACFSGGLKLVPADFDIVDRGRRAVSWHPDWDRWVRASWLNVAQMSLPPRTHRDVEQPAPCAFMSIGERLDYLWNLGGYDHLLHPLARPKTYR